MENLDDLLKMAQDAQAKLMQAQEDLDRVEVEGVSGGGLVRIRASRQGPDHQRRHRQSLLAPSEKQMVEDLVAAAINDARGQGRRRRHRGDARRHRRAPAPAGLQDALLAPRCTASPLSVSPLWRQAFWFSYFAWIVIELAIVSRDMARVKGRIDDRFTMLAICLSIGIGITLAFRAPRLAPGLDRAPPELLAGLGIALIWAGIGLRLWAVRTLGRFFRVTVTVQDDHRLVDTGPYARLRNPSYTGAMITMAGIGLAMGHWLSLAAMIVFPMLGFAWRIRVEEASLAARFGADYQAYRSRRWALLPPLW